MRNNDLLEFSRMTPTVSTAEREREKEGDTLRTHTHWNCLGKCEEDAPRCEILFMQVRSNWLTPLRN